jgi:hypothetical protein
MKTIVIDVANQSSANLFLELARKLKYSARILSKQEKEDTALLAIMEQRKKEETVPVSESLKILRKIK